MDIRQGDALEVLRTLPSESVDCCITSPPYWGLRDYGVVGQIGLEQTPAEYVVKLVEVFREVRRVLRKDGTLWLNLGDSYAANGISGLNTKGGTSSLTGSANIGHSAQKKVVPSGFKSKDLIGIPWRVALALQADGWWLRSDIIWAKPNPMPESVLDRPTRAHEYVFLLTKNARYFYDADAIKEVAVMKPQTRKKPRDFVNGKDALRSAHRRPDYRIRDTMEKEQEFRNARSVWTITPKPFRGAHFATFPPELARRCLLAGCPEGGVVLDPFGGAGTVGLVAAEFNRKALLIELNPSYVDMAKIRCGV